MGTSKGYIPPTTIPWKNAKRAITAFRNEPLSSDRMQNAIGHYANARAGNGAGGRSAARAVNGISGILGAFKSGSVNSYLAEINRPDLIGKSSKEIFDTLLYQFTNNGSSPVDRVLLFSIANVLDTLGIVTDEDFTNISPEEFLIDFLAEFVCNDFDRCFEEQLRKDVLPSEYDSTQENIHGYIRNTIFSMRDELKAQALDFAKLQDTKLVRSVVDKAYRLFSDLCVEEG